MTDLEMKSTFKAVTDCQDENLTGIYIGFAKDAVLNRMYPLYRPDNAVVPERYHTIVVQVAVFLFGKRGMEGATRYAEQGADIMFDNGDIPPALLKGIVSAVYVPGSEVFG